MPDINISDYTAPAATGSEKGGTSVAGAPGTAAPESQGGDEKDGESGGTEDDANLPGASGAKGGSGGGCGCAMGATGSGMDKMLPVFFGLIYFWTWLILRQGKSVRIIHSFLFIFLTFSVANAQAPGGATIRFEENHDNGFRAVIVDETGKEVYSGVFIYAGDRGKDGHEWRSSPDGTSLFTETADSPFLGTHSLTRQNGKTIWMYSSLSEKMSVEIAALNETIESLNRDLSTQTTALKNDKTALAGKLQNAEAAKTAADTKLKTAETDKAGLNAQIADLTKSKTDLSTQTATLKNDKTALEGKLKTAAEAKTAAETKLKTAETDKAGLNAQITTLTKSKTDLEAKVTKLDGEKKTLEGKITTLTADVARLQAPPPVKKVAPAPAPPPPKKEKKK
ncbi:MAG: hypothetical protein Q7T11_09390 [Deltaproteobacteria bacterium]|nr:hypothetical protein [Deltaproteobacteria bacterium]